MSEKIERAISKCDILVHLQQYAAVLHDSFVVRLEGPNKGKIEEPHIRFEIRCIEAAIKIVMNSPGL